MSAAFRRVEQIEDITDQLIRQLSEAEAELADLHATREEESAAHADEVGRLTNERLQLADHLQSVVQRTAEIEAQDEVLKKEMAKSAERAAALVSEIQAVGNAKNEAETRLVAERQSLAAELAGVRAREASLSAELEEKETQLSAALDKASMGTPVGRGAKVVLPMALRRIRETQEALHAEESRKAVAESLLAEVMEAANAREAQLQRQLENLDAERRHQVSEMQSSLGSMTRAAAGAAKEAAVKQEAVNKLAAEVSALDNERADLQNEVQEATHKCLKLEAQLAQVQVELSQVCIEREEAREAAVGLAEELSAAAATRTELSAALEANRQQCSALESSIATMTAKMKTDGALAAEKTYYLGFAVASAEAHAANTKLQLAQAVDAQTVAVQRCHKLEAKMRDQDASVAHLALAVAETQSVVADLNAELASAADATAAQKYKMLRDIDAMATQLGGVSQERDELKAVLADKALAQTEMEDSIAALHAELVSAETRHAEKVAEISAASESRLGAATSQLSAAAAAQDQLMAVNAELESTVAVLRAGLVDAALKHAAQAEEMEDRLAATVLQLAAAVAAQDALNNTNRELEVYVHSLEDRVGCVTREKDSLETEFAASQKARAAAAQELHLQLKAATDAQAALNQERAALEVQLSRQNVSIAQLSESLEFRTAAVAAKEVELQMLAAEAADRTAALSSQLQSVCSERDAMALERSTLSIELEQLTAALQTKENELAAVQAEGVASKQVLKLSFEKIKGLQQGVADAQNALKVKTSAVAERDCAIAELQEAARQREELAAALQTRLESIASASEARAADLLRELELVRESNHELEMMNAELAPQVEGLVAQLEAAAGVEAAAEVLKATAEAQVSEASAKLQAALLDCDILAAEKAAANADASDLRAELAQLRFTSANEIYATMQERDGAVVQEKTARIEAERDAADLRADLAQMEFSTSTKESANRQVMVRTFDRIRALQSTLAVKTQEVTELEVRLECAEDIAAQLAEDLTVKGAALAAARNDNVALERAMCRLRVDVELELEARQNAEKQCGDVQAEVTRLESAVGELRVEAAALESTLAARDEEAVEFRSEAEIVISTMKQTLEETLAKVGATVAQLESTKAESFKKEAASKEVTRLAFEKIRSLQTAIKEREMEMAQSATRISELSTELAAAQQKLSEVAAAAARHAAVATALMEEVKVKDASLAEMEASSAAANTQIMVRKPFFLSFFKKKIESESFSFVFLTDIFSTLQKLKSALSASQSKIEELSTATATKAAAIVTLQARIIDLEEDQLAEASARIAALQQEKSCLDSELKCAINTSCELEASLVAQSHLIEDLQEGVQAQKDAVVTAKRMGAIREAELARSLSTVETQLMDLKMKSSAELLTARSQIIALRTANESLVHDSTKVKELTAANAALQKEAERAQALEKDVEALKKLTFQYTALERANMELCAQIGAADAERRAAVEATKAAALRITKLQSHHLENLKEVEARERRGAFQRGAWGAVIVCALAILWSTAAVVGNGGKE